MKNPINQICAEEYCTGCYTCVNVCKQDAVIMVKDKEGFYRPQIVQENCIGCEACIIKCPVNNPIPKHITPISIYSGWSRNEEIRLTSTSGGVFAEFAKYFLNALDGVVFGVTMNKYLQACHTWIEKMDDLHKLQGSKYVQSIVGDVYRKVKEFLNCNRYVLFSGTPCQIAGLKAYLGREYETLYTVDLLCHGVPSPKLFADYVSYIENKINKNVSDIQFRCKNRSWRYYNIGINSHSDGDLKKKRYDYEGGYYSDPFLRVFLRNNALRPSCYLCTYANTERVADFTLADWWGYKPISEEDNNFEKKGVSLIFCNTERAKSVLFFCDLQIRQRTLPEAVRTNMSLRHPVKEPVSRQHFWSDYSQLSFDEMVRKWMAPEKLTPSRYIKYSMRNTPIPPDIDVFSPGM